MDPVLKRIAERTLSLMQQIIPKSATVVVHGTPVTEGNSVEMASALSRRYKGRLVVLVDCNPEEWTLQGSHTPVEFVKKRSAKGLLAYLRSELVFFTHGLYGTIKPGKRQIFVNLWHGDGVKRLLEAERADYSMFPATYMAGGTELWTNQIARDFKMPPGSELVFGNPRVLQFHDPVPSEFLSKIGVGDRTYILWMPTFRKSSITGSGYEDSNLLEPMSQVVEAARKAGICVIVKAHHQDAENRGLRGAISVDDATLAENGVYLYSLLGNSAALITDYSSVWTEYLLLDRPIGFVMPDAETYVQTRGLFPEDLLSWLPGPRLETKMDIEKFIEHVARGASVVDQRQIYAREKSGLVSFEAPADRILDELAVRGCFRHGSLVDDELDIRNRPRLSRVNIPAE